MKLDRQTDGEIYRQTNTKILMNRHLHIEIDRYSLQIARQMNSKQGKEVRKQRQIQAGRQIIEMIIDKQKDTQTDRLMNSESSYHKQKTEM